VKAGVTVGPELERRLRQILAAAVGPEVAQRMEEATSALARSASSSWYQQVMRRTGLSGRWFTELRVSSSGIQAAVVSGDHRQSRGKFATYFIRRPGPGAMLRRPVTAAEYQQALRAWRTTGRLPDGIEAGRPGGDGSPPTGLRVVAPHPMRSDGRVLLQELVLKPGRREAKALAAALARAAARGARG